MNFEWQTDESQDDFTAPLPAATARPRRHGWLLIIIIIAMLGALALYWQARRGVDAAENRIAADVLSSARLAQRTITRQDRELFMTLLSGRDPGWTESQHDLLDSHLLFGDSARALHLIPEPEIVSETLELSSELSEATVTTTYGYRTWQNTNVILLQQVQVYRQGLRRWLLSPPDESFWGPWQVTSGKRLTLHYPQRDEAIAWRLEDDLGALLEKLCAMPALDCAEKHWRIRLEKDLRSLLAVAVREPIEEVAGEIDLPAPTLVGEPVDEAAYAALMGGYAAEIGATVIATETGFDCCRRPLFAQALLDWQLHELGLAEWPLYLQDYFTVIDTLMTPVQLHSLWYRKAPGVSGPQEIESDELRRIQVYALVEFLMNDTDGISVAQELQRQARTAATVQQWARAAQPGATEESVHQGWREYLYRRANALQQIRQLPAQSLLVSCPDAGIFVPYRFEPISNRWLATRAELEGYDLVFSLPDDSATLLSNWRWGSDQGTVLWGQNETLPVEPDRPQFIFYPAAVQTTDAMVDPRGRLWPMWMAPRGEATGRTQRLVLLDIDSCIQGQCRYDEVPMASRWAPHLWQWAPGGDYRLSQRDGHIYLERRSHGGQELVAEGILPFWLDASTFGYFSQGVLFVSGTDQVTPKELMPVTMIFGDRDQKGVKNIIAARSGSGRFLVVTGGFPASIYIVTVDLERNPIRPREIRHLADFPGDVIGPPLTSFSPDGRWLTVYTRAQDQPGHFLLFDVNHVAPLIDAFRTDRFGFYFNPSQLHDWSLDGAWLARMTPFHVELVHPGPPFYRQFVTPPPHESGRTECFSLAWTGQ